MTNREKAQAISEVFKSEVLQVGAYLGSLEMAEWKDLQFKEYLQEKLKKYENGGRLIILDIINELFEEEQK